MASKTRKISTLIEQQLPGFISSEYENFSKFVEKYYEHLENQGQPLDIINNISTYRNIDYYEQNLLNQYTNLTSNINASQTTITVADASSFPKENGYIKIGDEICFYQERTLTQFKNVSRGVSGNNTLGDLYTSTEFITTQAKNHFSGDQVYNISNLFLYALIKNFESQYLDSFPEKYLKGEVDKRTLIKNISKFYNTKGTDQSIKFIFNSIISKNSNENVEVFYPKETTLKPSTSDWTTTYSLKVKVISGTIENLIGEKIEQLVDIKKPNSNYASAYIDNIVYLTEDIYQIILDPSSVNGTFDVISKTKLTAPILSTTTVGDRINVGSTLGWDKTGNLMIGGEEFKFSDKNVNQFVIESRSSSVQSHPVDSEVYNISTVQSKSTKFLILGVLYNLNISNAAPYSEVGDKIQISEPGVESRNPIVFNPTTSLIRWLINQTNQKPNVFQNTTIQNAIKDLNADVSGVYEDDQYFYICSSSYPSHRILKSSITELPSEQKILRLIRKQPINTTEIYETPARDVGIFVNGTPAYGCKDEEYVSYGKIVTSEVTYKGFGYKAAPYVLVDNVAGKASATMAGELVENIVIETDEIFTVTPKITITAGRNARARAIVTNGQITDIIVIDPGEYYSSPPLVRIIDLAGRGNFAEYTAKISNNGQVIGFSAINQGKFYTSENVQIELIEDARGSEAKAIVEIKKWYKNRFVKNQPKLDDSYGFLFPNYDTKDKLDKKYGYGYVANPMRLRVQLNDNLLEDFSVPFSNSHSPIIGYAYDGNPIYGPYGYSDPLNSISEITRLQSGYELVTSRSGGPSTNQYPLGSFVDDYIWGARVTTDKLYLDENNGRFCVTPDYPEGIYAYFITINQFNQPIFPYILGKNFYSLPIDSNYNSSISQDDLPSNVKRLRTSNIESNGNNSIVRINNTSKGNISGVDVQETPNTFQVGSIVRVNDENTGGYDASAYVSEVKGVFVETIESVQNKALEINLRNTAFLYSGDIITQASTGAYGEIIGNVIDSNQIILREVNGTFNTTNLISASINVQSILLDKTSNFTKDFVIIQTDNKDSTIATGVIIESITNQNTLKIKVTSGEFVIDNDYVLKSSNLRDSFNIKVLSVRSLSKDMIINNIDDHIAIAITDQPHNLTVGDKIDISIDQIDDDKDGTVTTYYVRKRNYQRIQLNTLLFDSYIDDTGIGMFEYLNTGFDYEAGEYTDVELIFRDSSKIRPLIGQTGNVNNARATITVSDIDGSGYGRITNINITNKGANYQLGDILTVNDAALNRKSNSISTQRLLISVEHVGFSKLNTSLKLTNIINLSINDEIKIGSEILKVTGIDSNTKKVTVSRGLYSTNVVNHYNNQYVQFYNPEYRFNFNFGILGTEVNNPRVFSYDKKTQTLVLVYDYTSTNPIPTEKNNVFYDNSTPQKIVTIASTSNVNYEFQFSKTNTDSTFVSNPIIDITKFYKYIFDTSHFSMADTYLDFSPSPNFNINTSWEVQSNSIEPGQLGSAVFVKFGYKNNLYINSNRNNNTNFSKYYYYDKNDSLNGSGGYLNIVNDPLQGEKIIHYATSDKFVYKLTNLPLYDGVGDISYKTTSKFAIGEISNVIIENAGENYDRIPTIYGVDVAVENEAILKTSYDSITKTISYVEVVSGGKNYVNPKAIVVDGDGYGAVFSVYSKNGKILGIRVINDGKNYTYPPTVKVIESDLKLYFTSDNIGIPKTLEIVENGYDYHLDKTLLPSYSSHLVLLLNNHEDNAFSIGEKIVQTNIVNGQLVEIASGFVSKNGWRIGSNILKLEKISGSFDPSMQIEGKLKRKTANITSILSSKFDANIKSYYDNIGSFSSEKGHISNFSQRITDSFYYQDYSYVIKSKTSINVWRDLIKQTTHPAGFELFGEVLVETKGTGSMPLNGNRIETITNINLRSKLVKVKQIKRNITQTILKYNNINVENGVGSISLNIDENSETIARELILSLPFNGTFDTSNGQVIGEKTFTLLEKNSNLPYSPYNEQQLIVTLDGILQEPGESYTISNNQITFSSAPFGKRIIDGQIVPEQKFYCRSIKFKNDDLNARYLRKLKSISNEFNGISKIFNLYYENGNIVKTDIHENLIVTLNGVLQNSREFQNIPYGNSYHIIRSPDPNITDKIEFSEPPINHPDLYENINTELANAEKCFIYGIGNYKRLTIDQKLIPIKGNGPFTLLNEVSKKIDKVEDSRYALVFVDGVLQIDGESYEIVGTTITFRKPLNYYISESGETIFPNVSVLVIYGRSISQDLTLFDFEPDVYYNIIKFNLQGANVFQTIKSFEILPNKMLSTQKIWLYQNNYLLGELKEIKALNNNDVELTVINTKNLIDDQITNSNLSFLINQTTIKQITGTYTISYSYSYNENGDRILSSKSNAPIWLYNTKLGTDLEETKKYKRISNILPGDLIKIDGEDDYRQVFSIPSKVKTKNFNEGEIANQEVYANISCSNYNGITRGEGLNITAEIFDGKVVNLKWNKRELELYLNNNIFSQPTAYQYYTNPVINFVPVDGNGGGAKAEIIICNGQILDVILLNSGYGYTTKPKVIIARKFSILKNNPRKVQSNIALLQLIPKLKLNFSVVANIDILSPDYPFIIIEILSLGSNFDVDLNIISHIWPQFKNAGINKFEKTKVSFILSSKNIIRTLTSTYTNITNKLELSSKQISINKIEKSITKFVSFGSIDKTFEDINSDSYNQGILGNSLKSFETAKFTDTGYSNVSRLTIEEFSIMYPDAVIEDFDIPYTTKITSNPKNRFNLGYHSIQEFGAYLQMNMSNTDNNIYIENTSSFPDQGKLLIGKEIVRYELKLSDRFSYVTRGLDGTRAEPHLAGEYMRTIPQ